MNMEDQEQLSYFPRAFPTKACREVCVWETRDVLENENYESVAPSGIFKMTTSQGNNILLSCSHCSFEHFKAVSQSGNVWGV